MPTLYEVLELNSKATQSEIKAAYIKFALMYHPDKNKDPRCDKAFVFINEANEILSDEAKRRIYDNSLLFGESKPSHDMIDSLKHNLIFTINNLQKRLDSITQQYADLRAAIDIRVAEHTKYLDNLSSEFRSY